MSGKFVIDKARNGQFYFNLRAGNGEPILKSEMYVTRASAEHGIASVKTNALLDERYDRKNRQKRRAVFHAESGQPRDHRRKRVVQQRGCARRG